MRRYMRKSYSNLKFPGVDNIFFILIGHYFGREVFLNPFSAYRWINAFAYFFILIHILCLSFTGTKKIFRSHAPEIKVFPPCGFSDFNRRGRHSFMLTQ